MRVRHVDAHARRHADDEQPQRELRAHHEFIFLEIAQTLEAVRGARRARGAHAAVAARFEFAAVVQTVGNRQARVATAVGAGVLVALADAVDALVTAKTDVAETAGGSARGVERAGSADVAVATPIGARGRVADARVRAAPLTGRARRGAATAARSIAPAGVRGAGAARARRAMKPAGAGVRRRARATARAAAVVARGGIAHALIIHAVQTRAAGRVGAAVTAPAVAVVGLERVARAARVRAGAALTHGRRGDTGAAVAAPGGAVRTVAALTALRRALLRAAVVAEIAAASALRVARAHLTVTVGGRVAAAARARRAVADALPADAVLISRAG